MSRYIMAQDDDLPPDINRGPEILIVTGTLTSLALVTVILRIWVRMRIVKFMGPEDWTMIAAMLVMLIEMAIFIPEVSLGAGRHWQYIQPPSNIRRGLHLNFVTQPLCLIALCLAKVSVGLFLVRIASGGRFALFLKGWILFTILSSLSNILTVFFQCQPLALTWNRSLEGSCLPPENLRMAALVNSSIAALTDVVFALIPIPMLWKVKLDLKAKIAILGVLSLGLLSVSPRAQELTRIKNLTSTSACAAAIVKITYLADYGKHGDFLFDSSDLTIWTTIEICVAIIAASIPCFKPLTKISFRMSFSDRYIKRLKRKSLYRDQKEVFNPNVSSSHQSRDSDHQRNDGPINEHRRIEALHLPDAGEELDPEMAYHDDNHLIHVFGTEGDGNKRNSDWSGRTVVTPEPRNIGIAR